MSGMYRPSSTASIPSTSILHVSVVHEAVKGVAVDCRFTISDAKRRIQKKLSLYNTDCSDWGLYEFHGSQPVRELGETEVLQNITKNWGGGGMYKFVFQPKKTGAPGTPATTRATRSPTTGTSMSSAIPASATSSSAAGTEEEEEYEKRLREQKARMNRLSVRLTNRKSQGINLTNQDKLREMKVEQMGKRLTLMHAELEAARKLSVQAEEFERKKREEEELMRAKANQLESKYQSLGDDGSGGGNRASITPAMQKQLDEMKAKRAATEGRLAQIEEQMAAKRRQRREAAAAAQEKQIKLMEQKLMSLEAELEKEDQGGDISQNAMEAEFIRMEEEQARWEQQRAADMKRQHLEFERERKEREARLKLQQDEMAAKILQVEKALQDQARGREGKVLEFKQKKVTAMEDRLKQLEAQLANGDAALEEEMREAAEQLSIEQEKMKMAQKERELQNREAKLNELFAKVDKIEALESMVEKLKNMPMGGFGGTGGAAVDFRSGVELKKEIESLQAKLMDPNTPEKDLEAANIALEKALDAYEKTPEYAAELAKQKEDWVKKNEPLNKAAFAKMSKVYNLTALKSDPNTLERVKKYPELRLLMMTSDTIMKKHESDFRTFVLNGLSEDELRAIRSVLPKFRTDQKAQMQFLNNLDQKIEDASSRPAPKPAVKKSGKKFVAKAPKAGAPAGDLFAELLAKKAGGGGGLTPSPGPQKSSPAPPPLSSMKLPPPGPPGAMPPLPPPGPDRAAATGPPPSLASDKRDLVSAMDNLLESVMSGDEKDIAAKTRQAVLDLKKLVATGKQVNSSEAGRLESMATLIVVGVKEAINGKKASEMEFMNAQSKLAQIIEKVKAQGNRIS